MVTPASSPFQISEPLKESEYSNAFYTVLGVNDVTIIFLKTTTIFQEELEKANAAGVVPVKSVASILLARSAAVALAKQILEQAGAEP